MGFFDWFKSTEAPEPAQVPVGEDGDLVARREQAEQIAARRPGRPEAGSEERTRRIGLTVSESEHARLRAAADAAGRKQLSRWCREVLFAQLENQQAVESGTVSADMQAQLARIGNNLNQLARAANRGVETDPSQVQDLQKQFQQIRRNLK